MRILYLAIDLTVPGTKGGLTHVMAVAEGLAALGHDVHALTMVGASGAFPPGLVHWHALAPPLGLRQLRFLRASAVQAISQSIQADIVIERYYNFGGEGMRAAQAAGIPYVLEVNAPIIDYDGSPKRILDQALLVEPMRRWRERQCAKARLIVTPTAAIVPSSVGKEKILEIEWGADTVRFHPGASRSEPLPFERRPGDLVAVFAGAFRTWHGARHLIEAVRHLRTQGRRDIAALMIGDGPELSHVRQAAAGLEGVVFTGAISHDRMPACLAAADVGVAPFDVAAHAPLALDFYWSPLKVFEYMSAGLPVVAPDIPRLRRIVTSGREGILYDASKPESLASALAHLADNPTLRASLGAAAREKALKEFGWDAHCRKLDEALRRCVS